VTDFARFILISLRFHWDFSRISSKFNLNFIGILLRFHLDFIRISLGSILGFPFDFTRNYPRILLNDKVTLLYIEVYLQNKKVNEYSTKDFIRIYPRILLNAGMRDTADIEDIRDTPAIRDGWWAKPTPHANPYTDTPTWYVSRWGPGNTETRAIEDTRDIWVIGVEAVPRFERVPGEEGGT
jgi:hypothetical protein